MNFIAHARIALWSDSVRAPRSTEGAVARFVLGAMLPDFASMAGTRLAEVPDADMASGVSLHHQTDEVFHGSRPFIALMQETMDALTRRGVDRGPARAVAHIGVELLIDGELVEDPEVGRAYLSALAECAGLPTSVVPAAKNAAFQTLARRLVAYGIPYDYQRPEVVGLRLASILAGRPRLALSAEAQRVVGSILPDVKAHVQERLPELFEAVREGLSHPRYSHSLRG